MTKRRITALIMCAVMTSTLLAGCGNSGSSNADNNNNTPHDSTQTASTDDEDKVITYWSIGTSEPDATILQAAVDKFNSSTNSGYTV